MLPTPLKSVVGLILSFVPPIYCGGLVYYFVHSSGSWQDAENNGLGPTAVGLSLVGLLSSIPLLVKLVLIFIELRKPRLGGGAGGGNGGGLDGSPGGGGDTFDADAVVARYIAQRQSETVSNSSAAARAHGAGVSAGRTSFGHNNKQFAGARAARRD